MVIYSNIPFRLFISARKQFVLVSETRRLKASTFSNLHQTTVVALCGENISNCNCKKYVRWLYFSFGVNTRVCPDSSNLQRHAKRRKDFCCDNENEMGIASYDPVGEAIISKRLLWHFPRDKSFYNSLKSKLS